MTKTLGLYFAAGLLAVVATAVVPVLATGEQGLGGGPMGRGPGPGGPGGGPGMGMRGPGPMLGLPVADLSDDQKQQVKSILDSHRDQMQQNAEKMRGLQEAMRTLVEADTIDESAIRAKSAEIASAEADALILQAKMRAEVFQILTPEQQQKAKEMQANRPQGRGARGGPGGPGGLGLVRPRQPGQHHH